MFMRYVMARIEQDSRDEAYRIYVTDALKCVSGIKVRYYDVVYPTPEDTRTEDDVKNAVFAKLKQLEGTS